MPLPVSFWMSWHTTNVHMGNQPISIDWGAISEIGFGATPEGLRVHEYWESHGIRASLTSTGSGGT